MRMCLEEPRVFPMESHEEDGCRYALFRLEFSGVSRFVFYAGDGKEGALELFDGDDKGAGELYRLICGNRLSVLHLGDVVRDAERMPKIF